MSVVRGFVTSSYLQFFNLQKHHSLVVSFTSLVHYYLRQFVDWSPMIIKKNVLRKRDDIDLHRRWKINIFTVLGSGDGWWNCYLWTISDSCVICPQIKESWSLGRFSDLSHMVSNDNKEESFKEERWYRFTSKMENKHLYSFGKRWWMITCYLSTISDSCVICPQIKESWSLGGFSDLSHMV